MTEMGLKDVALLRVPRVYEVARIDEVHDGDTWRMMVDLGFSTWARQWIRLQGVFAEELPKPGGKEALAVARDVLRQHAPEGWVKLTTFWTPGQHREIKEERTFIRYVGRVLSLDAIDLNEVVASLIPKGGIGKADVQF